MGIVLKEFEGIEFKHRVTFITGENGCGKSKLLYNISNESIEYLLIPSSYNDKFIRRAVNCCIMNTELKQLVNKYLKLDLCIDNIPAFSKGQLNLLILISYTYMYRGSAKLFLIDDPEANLHVKWQRTLIKDLSELAPNAQFIIATHSPSIVQKGWLGHCIELSNDIKEEDN